MLKRLSAVGLFAVVMYFTMGYYFQFLVEQHLQKREIYSNVSATLPFEGTVDFSVPLPLYGIVNSEYEAKQGEFFYKNKYYNILGSKVVDNVMIITCVASPKMQKLNQELLSFIDEYVLGTDDGSNAKEKKTLKFFSPEFAGFAKKVSFYLYDFIEPLSILNHQLTVLAGTLHICSPPPNMA